MATRQIGAQMYSIRDHCKTVEGLSASCKKLAEIGFSVVQASGLGVTDPKVIRQIFDDNGLSCVASHSSMDQLRDKQALLEWHEQVGCSFTAIGYFAAGMDRQAWVAFANEFGELANWYAERGLRLGYHNHGHELAPLETDPTKISPNDVPLQMILDQCPATVSLEIDTYWIQQGGGDPAAWIEKAAGRIPIMHAKDYTLRYDEAGSLQQAMCEIGSGNLNWPRIIEACKQSGVDYYVIERDGGEVDCFESLKISLDYLRSQGLE